MMPKIILINPYHFGLEFILMMVITILCILIFIKTKEIQNLSGKNSIKLFRYSFLFFGITYLIRFLLMTFMVTSIITDLDLIINLKMIISLIALSSFIAIVMLVASTLKSIQDKKNITLKIVIFGFLVFIISSFFASLKFLLLLEVGMFLFTLGVIYQQSAHEKKKNSTHKIYLLLFIFWIFSILALFPTKGLHIPREIMLIPQAISLIIFIMIYRKMRKWIR